MQRTFLTNLALVLVLNLLVKPFYILGIDAEVQVRVGAAAYGSYAALLSISFLLNIVLDLGITNWNARNVARHEQLLRKHLRGILGMRVLLALVYAGITAMAALVLGYRGEALGLLAILVLNQVLASLLLYLRSNIAGAQRYARDSVLSVLDRALLIVIVGWMLWGRGAGAVVRIEWFALAQTAAYGTAALVALVMNMRMGAALGITWSRPFSFMILRQSAPYALLILLMTFYYRTDMVMLERLLPDGAVQAGIYAQGFRFFEAFNMLGFLVAGLLLPMFSRMVKQNDNVVPLARLAWRLMLAASIAVAVLGGVFAEAIMELRYHEHLSSSAAAFAVLIQSFVAVSTTYVFGTLLTATGDLRALNRMAAGGMILNIVLNLALVPRYQALGAAIASVVTQCLTALAQALLARKRFPGAVAGADALRGVLFAMASVAVCLALAAWINDTVRAMFVAAASVGALAFATRLVDVSGVYGFVAPSRRD